MVQFAIAFGLFQLLLEHMVGIRDDADDGRKHSARHRLHLAVNEIPSLSAALLFGCQV